jgi:transcriptional regulator with XRE-family HTH domain
VDVDDGLGATLREARNRRKLDLSEVERAIKIRLRYLRAIENEEWEALPGGSYTRAFIRTYASFLGLDGERLAAEQARGPEPVRRERAPRVDPAPIGAAGAARGPRLSRRTVSAIVIAGLVALLLAVGLATGGGGGGPALNAGGAARGGSGAPASNPSGPEAGAGGSRGVDLSLATTAEVWVCVLDSRGRPLVDGKVLTGGVREGPFHSGSFTVAFGNGEVAMQIDGKDTQIPASASPLGYAIDSAGRLTPLAEAARPTCL